MKRKRRKCGGSEEGRRKRRETSSISKQRTIHVLVPGPAQTDPWTEVQNPEKTGKNSASDESDISREWRKTGPFKNDADEPTRDKIVSN